MLDHQDVLPECLVKMVKDPGRQPPFWHQHRVDLGVIVVYHQVEPGRDRGHQAHPWQGIGSLERMIEVGLSRSLKRIPGDRHRSLGVALDAHQPHCSTSHINATFSVPERRAVGDRPMP